MYVSSLSDRSAGIGSIVVYSACRTIDSQSLRIGFGGGGPEAWSQSMDRSKRHASRVTRWGKDARTTCPANDGGTGGQTLVDRDHDAGSLSGVLAADQLRGIREWWRH